MKINNLDLTFEWDTIRKIPEHFGNYENFPNYDVIIKNIENELIQEFKNINDYDPAIDRSSRKIPGTPKIKFYSSVSKNKAKSIFKYDFINNYSKYKEFKNKLGFFKKLKFEIKYNKSEKTFVEYLQKHHLKYPILCHNLDHLMKLIYIYTCIDLYRVLKPNSVSLEAVYGMLPHQLTGFLNC